VAVKKVDAALTPADPDPLADVFAEVTALELLGAHPRVVDLLDYGQAHGVYRIVTRLHQGSVRAWRSETAPRLFQPAAHLNHPKHAGPSQQGPSGQGSGSGSGSGSGYTGFLSKALLRVCLGVFRQVLEGVAALHARGRSSLYPIPPYIHPFAAEKGSSKPLRSLSS
jgi:hypothetical protein